MSASVVEEFLPFVIYFLLYKVKRQYVQISEIIDTSIKRAISGQSTLMVKGCIDIMFDKVDTAFSY